MKHTLILLLLASTCLSVQAQIHRHSDRKPTQEAIQAAYKLADQVFTNLKVNKTQEVADWMVAEIGKTWDASTKLRNTNEYKSKLDAIAISPPAGTWGKLDGYDLIDETYLPGSDRLFRLVYISYHEGAPVLWEFRFYVTNTRDVTLNALAWIVKDPFEFLAEGRMLVNRFYDK
jgi:hypothetical protein